MRAKWQLITRSSQLVMIAHAGSVRSFDLGGPSTTGRRWAARCSCGSLATADAWREAMTFLTQHLKASAPRTASSAGRLGPDLRGVDCWQSVVVYRNGRGPNGNGHAEPASRLVSALSTLVRVVLGALRVSLSN